MVFLPTVVPRYKTGKFHFLVQDLVVIVLEIVTAGLDCEPVLLVNPGAVASDMSTLNFPNDASGRIDIGYGPTAKSKQGFTVPNIV